MNTSARDNGSESERLRSSLFTDSMARFRFHQGPLQCNPESWIANTHGWTFARQKVDHAPGVCLDLLKEQPPTIGRTADKRIVPSGSFAQNIVIPGTLEAPFPECPTSMETRLPAIDWRLTGPE